MHHLYFPVTLPIVQPPSPSAKNLLQHVKEHAAEISEFAIIKYSRNELGLKNI